jgi:hypothetical protein
MKKHLLLLTMQIIYVGHTKNQQNDQHSYLNLCGKIQYKHKYLQQTYQ